MEPQITGSPNGDRLAFFDEGRPGESEVEWDFSSLRGHVLPPITCADGTSISVQASAAHYCSPRTDRGPWASVEVGFPSVRPEPWEEWLPFCESPDRPTDTVYGYVPIELVRAFVLAHGGVRP